MNTEEKARWTQAELVEEATRRFGEDQKKWAFQCPTCKDIATVQDFLDACDGDASRLGQECIGRSLGALDGPAERGCNWTAYGLFKGPWIIVMPGGKESRSFRLAPAPEDR